MSLTTYPEPSFPDGALATIYNSMGGGWVNEADKLAPRLPVGDAGGP